MQKLWGKLGVNCPSCTACPLYKTALHVGINGRGASVAPVKYFLLGQNPDKEDNFSGKSWDGPTGKKLMTMLKEAGYNLDECRFSNAVRCWTPGNRAPEKSEIEACSIHLKAELEEYKPQVIIALGDTALKALVGKGGVKASRGQEVKPGVFCTYHPSAALYTPNLHNVIVSDLRKFRSQNEPDDIIEWEWYDAEKHPILGMVSFDIETDYDYATGTGGDNIIQVSVAEGTRAFVARADWPFLGGALASVSSCISHNGWQFDVPRLREMGIPISYGRDTMVMAYLCDETQPLNLEALCVKYGVAPKGWKEGIHADRNSDEFALYNARDALYTYRLYHTLLDHLGTSRLGVQRIRIAEEVILPGKLALDECSRRGNFIALGAVLEAKADAEKRIAEAEALIAFSAPDGLPQRFNPNSTPQVGAVLAAAGYSLTKTPKSKQWKVDEGVLNDIAGRPGKGQEFAANVLLYRKARKEQGVIEGYEEIARSRDGRAHPSYHAFKGQDEDGGTVVGRTSCRNPNVQNLDRRFKHFLAAEPGNVFVTADYKALHFRIFADVADEKVIKQKYRENPNWEPHVFFASMLYRKPEAQVTRDGPKSEKQVAKSANFALMYIGNEYTLQDYAKRVMGLDLALEFCQEIMEAWHSVFTGARPYYARIEEELKAYGYVETPTGRRRHFGDIKGVRGPARMKILREAVNFTVLGFEPDIALPALAKAHEMGLPINYFCHDSIGCELEDGYEKSSFETQMAHAMCEHPIVFLRERFNYEFSVPLVVEFETH